MVQTSVFKFLIVNTRFKFWPSCVSREECSIQGPTFWPWVLIILDLANGRNGIRTNENNKHIINEFSNEPSPRSIEYSVLGRLSKGFFRHFLRWRSIPKPFITHRKFFQKWIIETLIFHNQIRATLVQRLHQIALHEGISATFTTENRNIIYVFKRMECAVCTWSTPKRATMNEPMSKPNERYMNVRCTASTCSLDRCNFTFRRFLIKKAFALKKRTRNFGFLFALNLNWNNKKIKKLGNMHEMNAGTR